MSTRYPRIAPALLVMLSGAACGEAPAPAPPVLTAGAAPMPPDLATPDLTTPREACLGAPAGADGGVAPALPALVDALRDAQDAVRRGAAAAAGWTAVGQAWLALAESGVAEATFAAEGCLEVALALDAGAPEPDAPEPIGALELEASLLMRQHRFAAALERSDAILARDPQRERALGIRCDALIELGRYEEAAEVADRAAALRPGPAMYARSAFFAFLRGDGEKAKIDMRQALIIGRDPRAPHATAWGFSEAARLFHNDGDYSGAEAVYREALAWAPDYPPALLGIGKALLAQERPREALSWLVRAAERGQLEALRRQGDAHRLLGDEAQAERLYARFESEAVHDRFALAQFLASSGRDPARALALVEAEADGAKNRGGIWVADARAWSLHRLGRDDEALVHAEEAIALGTEDPQLLYHAGAIMLAAGDKRRGRDLIARALAQSPRFDPMEARDAEALLAR